MEKNIETALIAVAVFTLLVSPRPAAAQAADPREILKQYVAQLKQTPGDNALREKIIKLAQQISPPLPIPEEARRHYVIAKTLLKDAQKPEDFGDAIEEFKSALLVAPWWGDANGELGMLFEAAGRYEEAIAALTLYIAANPGEKKARGAQDEIYIIEAKQKKAAREEESRAKAEAAKETQEVKRAEPTFEGRWYFFESALSNSYNKPEGDLAISNNNGQWMITRPDGMCDYDRVNVQGRQIVFREIQNPSVNGDAYTFVYTLTLSGDGKRLEGTQKYFFQGALQLEREQSYYRRE